MTEKLLNWAGNYQYGTNKVHYPKTLAAVGEVVKNCSKLKALGARHSFNGIGDSTENFISLRELSDPISLNKDQRLVAVGAGVRYGELCEYLHKQGFALHNLGSLPHISVAGACVSATHGSGTQNAILAAAVYEMELVTADSEVVILSRQKDPESFQGAVVNLGALGIVTRLTLEVQPSFTISQNVYQHLSLAELKNNFNNILSAGYSVSLFTNWERENFNQVWVKRRVNESTKNKKLPLSDFYGAKPATKNLHPIIEMPSENCTEQMGVTGPWHERLPHFRMNFMPSSGEELQSEYFIPYELGFAAIQTIFSLDKLISPYIQISEVRTIAADNFWMSPCYKRDSIAIHFTWKQNWTAVKKLLPMIEEKLEPFSPRTHWGKLFMMPAEKIQLSYEKLEAFQHLVNRFDQQGKFRNEFIDRYIFG